jgi:hypothetical protein
MKYASAKGDFPPLMESPHASIAITKPIPA